MKHTPRPWTTEKPGQIWQINAGRAAIALVVDRIRFPRSAGLDAEETKTNARLIAAAPDHAIVARLLASKKMRWEVFAGSALVDSPQGELCFDGMRYCTQLDEFGVPKLTDHLCAEIAKAEGRG